MFLTLPLTLDVRPILTCLISLDFLLLLVLLHLLVLWMTRCLIEHFIESLDRTQDVTLHILQVLIRELILAERLAAAATLIVIVISALIV